MKETLKQKIKLYCPHSGFEGAIVPLPKPMKKLANNLDGKIMLLKDALNKINKKAKDLGGYTRLVEEYKFISFGYKDTIGREHFFRLIRYEIATRNIKHFSKIKDLKIKKPY